MFEVSFHSILSKILPDPITKLFYINYLNRQLIINSKQINKIQEDEQ